MQLYNLWHPLCKAARYVYATLTTEPLQGFLSCQTCLSSSRDFALQKFTKQLLKSQRGRKYLALWLQNVASFIAGGYISLETHKLWNVRILCILIECGTVNGCGNSATWRLIPLCAISQPSPWASIKWQNGPILENNNNKNTSLYGNNIRSHLESTMVTACKWLNRDSVIRA